MPIDYSRYPSNWKTEIRPRILKRAGDCCEWCKVPNYTHVVRGQVDGNEAYMTLEGSIYSYPSGKELDVLLEDFMMPVKDMTKPAAKIVLTIAHLDHDVPNHDVKDDRLAALCQKCHTGYDAPEKARRRRVKRYSASLFPIE